MPDLLSCAFLLDLELCVHSTKWEKEYQSRIWDERY
jgi:hypothetical protein